MTEKYGTYFKFVGAFIDFVLLNFSGYIAYLLVFPPESQSDPAHINIVNVLLINFIWFNVTQVTKLYQNMFSKDAIPLVRQAISSAVIFGLLMFFLVYAAPQFTVSSSFTFYTLLFFIPLFLLGKLAFLVLRRSNRAQLIEYLDVVIVGAGPVGIEVKKLMEAHPFWGYRVIGFFDDKPELRAGTEVEDVYVLGRVNECIDFVKKYGIKEIYCALPDRALNKINALMREADKELIRFKLVPDVKDYFRKNVNVKMLGHLPVISSRTEPLEIKANMLLKRVFDIVFSLLVIVFVLTWLIPLFAILIKLESKGPVFFKQLRSGKDNLPFYCWKFRSMRVNADSDQKQARKNDSRITGIGAFMRKTSIDELPQFFNVLKGEMSVVGPRPHMLKHTDQYSALIDQFMVRHFVLPGITGWAQVRGLRGETTEDGSMEARVKADIWYLENWSILLDLKIAFLTVWQVVDGHKNAY
jgi:putative colanic acid biosynthesis UDP-glucose lipid carrier transferase